MILLLVASVFSLLVYLPSSCCLDLLQSCSVSCIVTNCPHSCTLDFTETGSPCLRCPSPQRSNSDSCTYARIQEKHKPPLCITLYTTLSKMSSTSDIPAPLVHIISSISTLISLLSTAFHKIPGSPIIIRYIRSSYQNDPWRSLLEVLLVAFALRTVLKGRTRGDGQSKSFIKFSNKVCRLIERTLSEER
jgi:hypothetical protein